MTQAALSAYLFFFRVIIVGLRQLRLQGGLVNRSKSLKAFKTIDSNHPCLRFPAVAPRCAGPAGPEISKAVARSCDKNTTRPLSLCVCVWTCVWTNIQSLDALCPVQGLFFATSFVFATSWAAGRCRHWKWENIKHQYHSIDVWWRSEFVVGGPACPSGTSREVPCRQGCNLTASQHSFDMSFLRMAVAMPHLVLHDKYQVMRSLDAEAARQRLLEPSAKKWPNLGWLPNWHCFAALSRMQPSNWGCGFLRRYRVQASRRTGSACVKDGKSWVWKRICWTTAKPGSLSEGPQKASCSSSSVCTDMETMKQ